MRTATIAAALAVLAGAAGAALGWVACEVCAALDVPDQWGGAR